MWELRRLTQPYGPLRPVEGIALSFHLYRVSHETVAAVTLNILVSWRHSLQILSFIFTFVFHGYPRPVQANALFTIGYDLLSISFHATTAVDELICI
jgi:hypothetical protein